MILILVMHTDELIQEGSKCQIQISIQSQPTMWFSLILFDTLLTLFLQQMVPTSPEGSKGSYPSQHYPPDEVDGASTTKDASSETEGWLSVQIYFMSKKLKRRLGKALP